MKNSITIRKVKEIDLPALLEIEHTIWTTENSPVGHYYSSLDEYKESLSGKTLFVAADADTVHGFVMVYPPTSLLAHQKQWMLAIGVQPASQSLGIGCQLLDFLKEEAAKEGIHKLALRVMSSNTQAIHFYRKNGFVQEALFKDEFFINGHYSDDYQLAFFID